MGFSTVGEFGPILTSGIDESADVNSIQPDSTGTITVTPSDGIGNVEVGVTPHFPLLNSHMYAPVGQTVYSGTSTTGLAAVDTTNMTISFVAPESGVVLVRLTATGYMASASEHGWWGLLNHNTSTLVGVPGVVNQNTGLTGCSVAIIVSGLTPGTTYQWDWGFGVDAAGTTHIIVLGSTGSLATLGGPATMEVWAT